MNKGILGGVALGVLLPAMSLGITQTREALLGLAPDEQILELANQIDSSRVENEAKAIELQAIVDSQNAKLAEQQKLIDDQKLLVEKTKADVVSSNVIIKKETECNKLYAKQPICQSDSRYQTKAAFDNMINSLDLDTKSVDRRKEIFNECQEIISKCD